VKEDVIISISDKVSTIPKKIIIEKEKHCMIKESIHQEDTAIFNVYTPNIKAIHEVKKKTNRTERKLEQSRIMVADFNTIIEQKISKDTEDFNNTIKKQDLIYGYTTHHYQTAEYTLFSSAHKIYTKISHILGHKVNLNKLNRIEIFSVILQQVKCNGKISNHLEINTLVNNPQVKGKFLIY
jgi:hypothetical protein